MADPVPLYAWRALWRTGGQHAVLPDLLAAFAAAARARDWLPESDAP